MTIVPNNIVVTFERVICPRHGEPFRSEWPKGYAIMAVRGFAALWEPAGKFHDELMATAPPEALDDDALWRKHIEAALDTKPICCRIGEERLFEIYREAAIGRKAVCEVCFKTRLGSPMLTRAKNYRHVCFECTLYRMRMAQ